jgi:hypothetical protein
MPVMGGKGRGLRLPHKGIFLSLSALLMCAGWLAPVKVSAATDTYYFQNVTVSDVCAGTSTINQSGEANVLPGGTLVSSDNYQTGGWYHFNWDSGATTAATSLANDVYTAPFTSATKITGLKLKMEHTFTYNPVGYAPPANMYAKFFDVDGNAPCSDFEQGTLIAQTAESTWLLFNQAPSYSTISVNNIYYTIQPGHRIRVELWNNFSSNKNLQVRYGAGTTTGLSVDYLPPPPDPAPTPNTTVSAGTAPSNVTIAPGATPAILHKFTLQTSSGTDRIDTIKVALTPYTASSVIGNIAIYADAPTGYYGSVSNPTGEFVTIPLYYAIYPTTTPTQYRVLVTPKSHTDMPVPAGAEYTITGTVEGINSLSAPAYTGVYLDAANSTVTIDNRSPAAPIWGSSSAGDSTVALNWINPADADFHSVVVLRGTAAVTATPVEGVSYSAGNTIGSSTVVYAGTLQSFTDGLSDILWNGTPYYYRIFARDVNGNYSLGAAAGPFTPVQNGTGTVTVGDGTNPANNVAGIISSGQIPLDAFTITSWPPSHLTSVAVTFPPGTASYLSQVYLTNASDTIIRNTTPTADTVILSGLNLTLSNALSSFKIKVDLKSSSPPPAGTEAAITGTITAIAIDKADMDILYSDTASATVIYDHKAPANPVLQYANPADGNVNMRWTDPADADTYGTLILRNTVPVTDTPQDGSDYNYYNGNIGSSLLVHNSKYYTPLSVETLTWSTAVNGTTYYYKLFARDARHNYSTGLAVGPVTPDVTVTVGNGTEPANTVIAPGSSAAPLDAFTLSSSSSATIDSVTVTLSSGALEAVGSVRITSGDGTTVYGSVANPAVETVAVPTTGITAATTPLDCRIEIIPKEHAAMPAVPGDEIAVTGRVTAVTTAASSYKVYNDTGSGTVTVDNKSPGNPSGVSAIALDRGFEVNWDNPPDADFSSILVLRNTVTVTDQPVEGTSYSAGMSIGGSTVAYAGNGQSFIERGLTNGASYHYRVFARDSRGNYSAGGGIGPLSPLPSNQTVAGTATAVMQGIDAIAVDMPFTDDANGNGSCAMEYKLSAGASWTPWLNGITRSATACTATITGLTAGSRYDVRMTYTDGDGILGTASQTASGIVALALVQTGAGTVSAAFTDSSTITVTAPFSNDVNHDNSFLVEYKQSSASDWSTLGYYSGPPDSPYVMWIGGLPQLVPHDIRATFSDPDGVNGTAVQTITGLVAPSAQNPKIIHNSLNANNRGYWAAYGGWGVSGSQYGEFTCMTCHEMRVNNAAGIKPFIMLMPIPGSALPGSENFGGPVRFDGPGGAGVPYGFGDDSVPRPAEPPVNRICEVCHTLTEGGPPGQPKVPEHRKIQTSPANHNPSDCTSCHRHDNGFASPWANPGP